MKKNSIKTKGALKEEISRYLQNAAEKKGWKVEDFTLSSISKHTHENEKRVGEILDELESGEPEVVKTLKIEAKIYLPQTDNGKEITKELSKKKLIMPLSPYVAFTIAMVVFLIAGPYIASDIRGALFFALIFGVILASVLQWSFREFMKWKVVSEETYRDVIRILKFGGFIFLLILLFVGVYYVYNGLTGNKMMPEYVMGIISIILASVGIVLSYAMWKKSK